jgi:hypothetical protein
LVSIAACGIMSLGAIYWAQSMNAEDTACLHH